LENDPDPSGTFGSSI